jgi:hypothetical protein
LKGRHPSGITQKPQKIRVRRDPTTKTAEVEADGAQPPRGKPV